MTGGHIDRARAERLMAAAGLDALVLHDSGSIRWASGAHPGVATGWRRAGAAFLLVPRDASAPLAAVVGDLEAERFRAQSGIAEVSTVPIWVETADVTGLDEMAIGEAVGWVHADRPLSLRPSTFDPARGTAALADILALRGLSSARIGLEEALLALADGPLFRAAAPGVEWRHGSRVVERLRMVKTPDEQAKLALGARAAEQAVLSLYGAMREGMTTEEMVALYTSHAKDAARLLGRTAPVETWAYVSVGPDGFAPGGPLERGDVVKIDVGVVVDGYSSDSARTVCFGEAPTRAREVHDALHAGFETGAALLAPGARMADVHAAMIAVIRGAGFPSYARGHFGHSLGASVWSEEWPFFAPDSEERLEPGMVVALEAPFYLKGLGGFIIEDQFTIHAGGATPAWGLPRDLQIIDARA